ncbi:MAG TPA: hypothetical protein VKQ30_03465 [Ktedonobacterales bacterium]|nr:hypothetical protein [Ktedonobacterales bacterium]
MTAACRSSQVISRLNLRALDQAEQQRVALRRADDLELGGVEHLGLGGEVTHFGGCQAGEHQAFVAEDLEPAQVSYQLIEV